MKAWGDERILTLLGIEVPIIQAPMAGVGDYQLAIAVARAGGLGSLLCALLGVEQVREAVSLIRAQTAAPLNLNFFCHASPVRDQDRLAVWEEMIRPYATEFGLPPTPMRPTGPGIHIFDESFCSLVEDTEPQVVSFHFGLPEASLVARVRATGAKIIASATTVAEARWLASHGCDAIIAMGTEAGGHRGTFLPGELYTQAGTVALVSQDLGAGGGAGFSAGRIPGGGRAAGATPSGRLGWAAGSRC